MVKHILVCFVIGSIELYDLYITMLYLQILSSNNYKYEMQIISKGVWEIIKLHIEYINIKHTTLYILLYTMHSNLSVNILQKRYCISSTFI